MDSSKVQRLPERNPQTHAEHRREAFWQITVPLGLGSLLVLAAIGAIVFSATQPATELNRWAGVSVMWIILPSLFIALLILIFLVGIIYGITLLLRITPRYARIVQLFFETVKTKVSQITDFIAEPILRIHCIGAVLQRRHRETDPGVSEH